MKEIIENFSEEDIIFALYGLLLGDGSYSNGWIYNVHTNKQRFYCQWLENIFLEFGLNIKTHYDYIKHTTFGDVLYSHVCVKAPNRLYFETPGIFFDDNKKKIISDNVLANINELGLLFWFLDDGQWHVSFKNNSAKRFGYLNTQSFTYSENLKIQAMFKERFDIDLKIHTKTSNFTHKTYYRLYFNATNFRKFFDLVRPYLIYIPQEFYYKFDMKYYPNRMKKSKEYSEKYNLPINVQ